MNFTDTNPMFDKVTVRPFSENDLLDIESMIRSQPKMFGTDITTMHDSIIESFSHAPENSNVFVAIYEGKVSGVMRVIYWRDMPFWSVGGNFTRIDPSLNYVKNRIISLQLYKACMMAAEKDERYDGYILLPDSENARRKKLHLEMIPWIRDRYDVSDVEIIQPFSKSKWAVFRTLFGSMDGKNTRPLVIRHSHLRSEFRNEN